MRAAFLLLFVVACRGKDAEPLDTGSIDSDDPAVDADGDGFAADVDCDDSDPLVHPEGNESCNGVDDDCDGEVDEDANDALAWFADADGDGFGDDALAVEACTEPSGYSGVGGDCDDSDPAFHPGAAESDCTDAADYNCDGSVGYADGDEDGFPACQDCDDGNAAVNEAAAESCNGIDDDCDGRIDSDDPDVVDATTFYGDSDGDGYGGTQYAVDACSAPVGYVATSDDCDDLDASSHPGGTEVCDGADNNCDGTVDEGVGLTWYADSDADGYGDSATTAEACDAPVGFVANADDCDDSNASTSPASFEVCDGVDNNCDGNTDDASAINAGTWYADADGDGYGNTSVTQDACDAPTGFVSNAADCNDGDAAVNPGGAETCDGVDQDCNGAIDDNASDTSTWYADADGDGLGDATVSQAACDAPLGYVADNTDCDDTSATDTDGDGLQDCADDDADGDGLRGTLDADDLDATVVRGPTGGSGIDGDLALVSGETLTLDTWTRTSSPALTGDSSVDVENTTGFATGDEVLLLSQSGSGVGQWQFVFLTGISGSTLAFVPTLDTAFETETLVAWVPHYDNVTVDTGAVIEADSWEGSGGGVVVFRAAGDVTLDGEIDADNAGWRGGTGVTGNGSDPTQGESYTGTGASGDTSANGGGGGAYPRRGDNADSGGGGSYGTSGTSGTSYSGGAVCNPGDTYGAADLSGWFLGSGGGGGSPDTESDGSGSGNVATPGGDGGGLIGVYVAGTLTIGGRLSVDGEDAVEASSNCGEVGSGGGGSGGQVLLVASAMSLSGTVGAEGGQGANSSSCNVGTPYGSAIGGDGGDGRIRLDYGTLNGVAFPAGDLSLTGPTAGYSEAYSD